MRLKNSAFRLHKDDPVFMCSGDGLSCFEKTREPALVFFHPPWYVGVRYALKLCLAVRRLQKQGVQAIICCNQRDEVTRLRLLGVKAVAFNQNMHLSEKLYHPVADVENEYDAIYVAQARPFKRMHLASTIERLYVLTYGCKSNAEGENDLLAVEPTLANASFNKGFIHDKEMISNLFAASSCGLALSSKEGAMWASMEYLMAGLPIVSTKNVGGRDHYFREDYVREVADSPEAVKAGVDYFMKNPPNRNAIREAVLDLVINDRKEFHKYIKQEAQARGYNVGSYEYIWDGAEGILDRHIPINVG